jgi:hypothetical protein
MGLGNKKPARADFTNICISAHRHLDCRMWYPNAPLRMWLPLPSERCYG